MGNGCGGGLSLSNSSVQPEGSSTSLHSGYVLFVNNFAGFVKQFTCFRTNKSIGTPPCLQEIQQSMVVVWEYTLEVL